ncbi:hypothetical protein MSWHS_1166 [Methanosarcina sp. WWM596]|nr:hypothetical protein MSWHS_1166 [Methanosarcina sp. WWM596]
MTLCTPIVIKSIRLSRRQSIPEKEWGEVYHALFIHSLYIGFWYHIWCSFEGLPSGSLFNFYSGLIAPGMDFSGLIF